MHYGFFANKEDKLAVLDYILEETGFRIFESYSTPDQDLIEFTSTKKIENKFDLEAGGEFAINLMLWNSEHGQNVVFRKIVLKPASNNGATFRFALNGWGLIQLNLGGNKNGIIHQSKISGWNEKGASKQEPFDELGLGKVDKWDWKEVRSSFRKLKYHLHQKMAVQHIGSQGILPGANNLIHSGFRLL